MRALLLTVTAAFTLANAWIVQQLGYLGFFRQLLSTPAGWQTFVDLSIALSLALVWMWRDSHRLGCAFWPSVPVTLLLGSLGPLLYLVRRPRPGA